MKTLNKLVPFCGFGIVVLALATMLLPTQQIRYAAALTIFLVVEGIVMFYLLKLHKKG